MLLRNLITLTTIFCVTISLSCKNEIAKSTDKKIDLAKKFENEHLAAFKEYNSALKNSARINKPILLHFTGHTVVNALKMDNLVFNNLEIIKFMNDHFIVLKLFVDDKTELPKNEWISNNETNEVLKTVEDQNQYIQKSKFNQNTQPFFVIIDRNEKIYGTSGYTSNKENFKAFLNDNLNQFNN